MFSKGSEAGATWPGSAQATKLALIGNEAKRPQVHGGGSGSVVPRDTSTPFDAISAAVGSNGSVAYDDGVDPARAAALAASAEVAIVCVATSSGEGRGLCRAADTGASVLSARATRTRLLRPVRGPGQLAPGEPLLYVRRTRTRLARAVRAAYRGTAGRDRPNLSLDSGVAPCGRGALSSVPACHTGLLSR